MYNIFSSVIYSATQFCLNLIALLMNWIFQLIDCIGLSRSSFFGAIDRDFIAQIFPKLDDFSADFTVIGYFIAFVLFIFGLFMLLFPYSDFEPPAENAFQLVFRFGVALIMVFGFEKFFLEVLYDKLIVPMFNYFNGAVGVTENVWNGTEWFLDTLKGRISAGFTSEISQILNFILVIIFGVMFIIQALKFTIYHYEKLFFTRLLIYCLPIVSGTLATKKSSSIFKNYFNMLLVNCISLIINVFICGLIMSGLLNVNAAATKTATNLETQLNGGFFLTSTKTFIVGLMLLTAALKIGKKMSVYISQLFNMNGMSDAVRDGLGMFSMAIGYAGHMASQHGMRNALKKQNEEKNQIAKETNAELHNIASHLDDLKDNHSGQAYANGYNEAMFDKDADEAMEKTGLNNIKSVDLDESVNDESNGTDTEKSKPSSPDNYNNPLDNKENVKAADTENGQSSDNNHNENSEMDGKNIKAADTANGLNSSDADKQSNNSESKDTQNINAASIQTPNTQAENDNHKSNPDSSEYMDKKDAVQTDNSQIQNNQKEENGTDTEKGNIQNNSKYENSQNNTQSQNGINTENTNSSALNNNQSEGKNIDNSNSTVNGGKSVQNNETNSSAVNAGNHSSVLEKKSSNGSGAANISSGDRNSYHSGSSNSSVQQNNVSTVQNSSSVNNSTPRSKNSASSNSHSVNTSGNGSFVNNISSNDKSQRNSVNTVHTQSVAESNANNHGRMPHRNHKTQNDHKTEI